MNKKDVEMLNMTEEFRKLYEQLTEEQRQEVVAFIRALENKNS